MVIAPIPLPAPIIAAPPTRDSIVTVGDLDPTKSAPLRSSVASTTSNNNRAEEASRASTVYGKAHVPAQVHAAEFLFPGEAKFLWDFSGDSTILQVKEDLWRLKDNINVQDLKEPDLYCLKFRGPDGELVELFDEQQLLQNVSMMATWKARGAKPTFQVDFRKKAPSKQEQLVNMKIGNLIGFGLYQFDYLKDPEVDTFRRRVERVRRVALRDRDPFKYFTEPLIETFPASETVLRMAPNGKMKTKIHLAFKDMDKMLLGDSTIIACLDSFDLTEPHSFFFILLTFS